MLRRLIRKLNNENQISIIDEDLYINQKELYERIQSIASLLNEYDTKIISIFLPNSSSYISSLLGVFTSGKTAFPLNPQSTAEEVHNLLEFAEVDHIITSCAYKNFMDVLIGKSKTSLNILYYEEISMRSSLNQKPFIPRAISLKSPLVLLNTSGTTGNPKIVQLSEENVLTSALGFIDKINLPEENMSKIKYLVSTPLFTSYGIMMICVCFIAGIPLALMHDEFTLNGFYKFVEKHRITHYEGGALLTTLMEQTLGRSIPYDISSLKYIASGGNKISKETIQKIMDAHPTIRIWQGYGMTETGPLISKPSMKEKKAQLYLEKLDSVGDMIPNVKVFIEDQGNITDKPNTIGEILVQGTNVMMGYYKNEAETNKVLKGGYLYTGDIGYMDEDGYLYICGRKKNIIIVRGINVYPEEVEACLMNSNLLTDAYVYGRSSSFGNEMVCADLILKNPDITTEEILDHLEKKLSKMKHPTQINYVKEIKRGITGKILRGNSI